jgi:hypothetical protein
VGEEREVAVSSRKKMRGERRKKEKSKGIIDSLATSSIMKSVLPNGSPKQFYLHLWS